MALLFADGMPYDTAEFAKYTTWDNYDTSANRITVETSGGRFGGRWIKHSYTYRNMPWMLKYLKGNYTTLIVSFGFWLGFEEKSAYILWFKNADAVECGLRVRPGNLLQVYLNGTGTAGDIATAPLFYEAWHQIEVKATFNGSTGSIEVRLNGTAVIDQSNVDTSGSGYDHCNIVQFGHSNDYSTNTPVGFSDIIIMDSSGSYCNDFLGPRRVVYGLPTDDGSYSEFVPDSSEANYECVDEDPANDDTNYNESDGSGSAIDTFVIPDLSGLDTIDAAVCSIYGKEPNGGLIRAQGVCVSGSTSDSGPEVSFSDDYRREDSPIYVDPNTSLPFTLSGFNNAEFGYEKVM